MVLNDQQLRQELMSFGETVPPITQRNREQLRARLDVLRSQARARTANSPARSHGTASPSRTRSGASPSASPSRLRATASPSRARATTNTTSSRPSTRSRQTPNLIELSDSETDSGATDFLLSRSVRAGQTAPNVQTRSIALRSHDSPTSLSASSGIGAGQMTNDVEQSIARHRREIKQLLDSARDRNRVTSTNTSSLHSGQHNEPATTPFRSSSKTRAGRQSSKSDGDDEHKSKSDHDDKIKQSPKSDHDDKTKRSPKSDHNEGKKSSSLKRFGKPITSFWKKYLNIIKNILKALLVGSIFLAGVIFLTQKGDVLFPHREGINCSVENATQCENMMPVIAAVRKHLQVRTGEVDCGFRPKTDVLVKRSDIERYLNEKGLKFNLGNEERWNALITYILEKPINDILIWNDTDQQTKQIQDAKKLSTPEAIRSLQCRIRQDVSSTIRNLILLILGSTGLLTLAWFLQRKSKDHEENERRYEHYLHKATDLLREQYEKHVTDPGAQPWLAISHIRDKLIPEHDQERLKHIWDRVKKELSKQESRIRSHTQEVDGKIADVWQWIKSVTSSPSKNKSESPKKLIEENDDYPSTDVGLTECLKLRNCFRSDNYADDDEIDHVVDSIQNRCAKIKRIEHIGIHSLFVYLKFSSKEAAAQGYHLLNNWKYQDQEINAKYIRLNRYYEHFPEAKDADTNN